MAVHIDRETGLVTIGCTNAGETTHCETDCSLQVEVKSGDGKRPNESQYEIAIMRSAARSEWVLLHVPVWGPQFFCTARCFEHYMSHEILPCVRAILIAQDQQDVEDRAGAIAEAERILGVQS